MEYIVENVDTKDFLKVNGTMSHGIAFLKIFKSEDEASDFIEKNLPHDDALHIIKYEGFTS